MILNNPVFGTPNYVAGKAVQEAGNHLQVIIISYTRRLIFIINVMKIMKLMVVLNI